MDKLLWYTSMDIEYEDIVQKDIELHKLTLEYCARNPWINRNMKKIVSKYPWQDICVVVWIAFCWGVFEIGPKFFWVSCINLGASFVTRKLLEAKRPVEYDSSLRPTTDTNVESYGFPSLESYMAVVIFGQLMMKFQYVWLWVLAVSCIFLVGFSRVYTCARFPHQILGSWVLGFLGLQTGSHLVRQYIHIDRLVRLHHWWPVAIACLMWLAHLALCVENNDSRLAHVPKKEFLRVLVDILNGTTTAPEDNYSTVRTADGSLRRVRKAGRDRADNTGVLPSAQRGSSSDRIVTPRSATIRKAVELEQKKSQKYFDRVKRDSFYHLQRGMMIRDAKLKGEDSSLLVEEEFLATPRPPPKVRQRGRAHKVQSGPREYSPRV